MQKLRIVLASGASIEASDDFIEEIDEVVDRIQGANYGKPGWVIFGDCCVHTQAVNGIELL